MAGWLATWQDKARPVAEGLFDMLETKLPEPGLRKQAEAVAEEEAQRVGADIVSRSVVSA
jgi:hypothetical protein